MSIEAVERIANAILYEGYLLYPYRRSALKNQRRWDFGIVYPPGRESDNEPSLLRTECLAEIQPGASIQVHLRFLQAAPPESVEDASPRVVSLSCELGGVASQSDFEFSPSIRGRLAISAERLEGSLIKLSLTAENRADAKANRQQGSLLSTHAILSITNGLFLSLLDPPEAYRDHASRCRNSGLWPVLAGEPGSRNLMLASPIILYDYPAIAPESAGDFFDGTEIDELLTLRVRTLTAEEKEEVRNGDPRGRAILDRSEQLGPEELLRMHGSFRSGLPDDASLWESLEGSGRVDSVQVCGVALRPGDRVRLRPQRRADVLDIALNGRYAVIEAIEQDYEDQFHFAVILDDDPGRDLGAMRQIGHRFFFAPDEVEPIQP